MSLPKIKGKKSADTCASRKRRRRRRRKKGNGSDKVDIAITCELDFFVDFYVLVSVLPDLVVSFIFLYYYFFEVNMSTFRVLKKKSKLKAGL